MTTMMTSSLSNPTILLRLFAAILLQSTLHLNNNSMSADACSVLPPCDLQATQIHLTNITGIVHVDVNQHEACPWDWNSNNNNYEPIDSTTIEVEIETQTVRTNSSNFVAMSLDKEGEEYVPLGLDLPTVDQMDFASSLRFEPNSEVVSIVYQDAELEYTLTGLDAPESQGMYEGIIVFRSEFRDRVYFIYPTTSSSSQLASCQLQAPYNCNISTNSVADYDFFDIDKMALDRVQVWEHQPNMNLVALPLVCCLCVNARYFTLDESGLSKQVEVLGNTINPIAVDSRIGMAYAVSGGYGQNITIVAEALNTVENNKALQLSYADVFVDELQQPSQPEPDMSASPSVAPVPAPVAGEAVTDAPVVLSADGTNVPTTTANGSTETPTNSVPTKGEPEGTDDTKSGVIAVGVGMSWRKVALSIIPFLFLL
mmetsp:Transcript_17102/g.26691  ORF Transcript_17102/g.26691 Transcript_17102/m.26691 type:complete len:427 (-) Transcript_17102:165-1445(-)